jgi:hypothetical protein
MYHVIVIPESDKVFMDQAATDLDIRVQYEGFVECNKHKLNVYTENSGDSTKLKAKFRYFDTIGNRAVPPGRKSVHFI